MKKSTQTSVLYTARCLVGDFHIRLHARHADETRLPIHFGDWDRAIWSHANVGWFKTTLQIPRILEQAVTA